jgi:hypothetical protein
MSATEGPISFERQIKPLFRDSDRQSMKWAFDLWSHDDVASVLSIVDRKVAHWRDYLDPLAVFDAVGWPAAAADSD